LIIVDLTEKVLVRLKEQEIIKQEINKLDDHGNTPLHYAASVGIKGVTSLLVAKDANMKSTRDRNNMCPIHIAASVGAMDAIRALVSGNKNDPFAALPDGNGGTFLHVAVKNSQTNVVKFVCRDNRFSNILNKEGQ
jgi:ankyrin repeat protein